MANDMYMQYIAVTIYCLSCTVDDNTNSNFQEMNGGDIMVENTEAGTQSRTYSCPICGNSINVVLIVQEEKSNDRTH